MVAMYDAYFKLISPDKSVILYCLFSFIDTIPFSLQIYICGFTAEEKDRIYKILNSGGATRFDTIHSNISHVIVGVPNKSELSLLTAKRTE